MSQLVCSKQLTGYLSTWYQRLVWFRCLYDAFSTLKLKFFFLYPPFRKNRFSFVLVVAKNTLIKFRPEDFARDLEGRLTRVGGNCCRMRWVKKLKNFRVRERNMQLHTNVFPSIMFFFYFFTISLRHRKSIFQSVLVKIAIQ